MECLDVHICGLCKIQFNSIDDFVIHKSSHLRYFKKAACSINFFQSIEILMQVFDTPNFSTSESEWHVC